MKGFINKFNVLCFLNILYCEITVLQVNAEDRLSSEYITLQLNFLDNELKKLEKDGIILEEKIRSGKIVYIAPANIMSLKIIDSLENHKDAFLSELL